MKKRGGECMEIETKNVEHFKKAGMVLSAKCWRERSSQIRTERYPLVVWQGDQRWPRGFGTCTGSCQDSWQRARWRQVLKPLSEWERDNHQVARWQNGRSTRWMPNASKDLIWRRGCGLKLIFKEIINLHCTLTDTYHKEYFASTLFWNIKGNFLLHSTK